MRISDWSSDVCSSDPRAYAQARAVLDSMSEDMRKVVVTRSYHFAAEALDQHQFVLLIGEPASGKTTIASMLAMASADQWGASVLKLNDPAAIRQEERRVGEEGVSTCRTRWSPDH